jgi:TorA maturation chaperone TorD
MEQDLAQAISRARAWTLLGELLLKGVSPELEPVVRNLPVFQRILGEDLSVDELAAEHQRVLGFEVFPYESVFLSEDGQLGGPVTEGVAEYYAAAGFGRSWSDVEGDHLGVELLFMANLCAREVRATELDRSDLEGLHGLQRDFLEAHLLRWLPPMVAALRGLEAPFTQALVEMSLELAMDHRQRLGPAARVDGLPATRDLESLLTEPKTRLKDVARFLLSPASAGFFLCRHEISALSAQAGGPRGFGGRLELLESTMFGAVDRGDWPAFVHGLGSFVDAQLEVLAELDELGAPVAEWKSRASITRSAIDLLLAKPEGLA